MESKEIKSSSNNAIPDIITSITASIYFSQFEELEYYIPEEMGKNEAEVSEIMEELGDFSIESDKTQKDGRQCIRTIVIHFTKFNLYIKETQKGPCHYRDLAIDGLPDEVHYEIVKPVSKTSIEFE